MEKRPFRPLQIRRPQELHRHNTPPKFNSEFTPEKWWLKDVTSLSYWVSVTLEGRAVKLREGNRFPQSSEKNAKSSPIDNPQFRVKFIANNFADIAKFIAVTSNITIRSDMIQLQTKTPNRQKIKSIDTLPKANMDTQNDGPWKR